MQIFLKWPWIVLASSFILACGHTVDENSGKGNATSSVLSSLPPPQLSFVSPQETIDLNNYSLTRKHRLPDVAAASAVTYNADTDTLFMIGDLATAIVQINKTTAEKIDSMSLKLGDFFDTEGLSYVSNGQFVVIEERVRQVNLFKYQAGTSLTRADVKSVKLGVDVGNIGIEGISYDPLKSGYVLIKEKDPQGIFETTLDFNAGTASNGAPNRVDSVNLFDPALIGVVGLNDLSALSNVLPSTAPDYSHLIVLSSQSGLISKMDRTGKTYSTLDISTNAHNEGITFDKQYNMYVCNELGSIGNVGEQELWVYTPTRDASAVGLGSNFYLTFNANVVIGAGAITISDGVGDTRSIQVTDTNRVRISGTTVMINPKGKLKANTAYTIQYPSGAFKEAGTGNLIPGVTTSTVLGFTTTLPAL
jgi:uncharacterized protein YjiK